MYFICLVIVNVFCYLNMLKCICIRVLLQSVRDSHSNQLTAAFQLYERDADTLDLYTCTQRTPVAPSIADMLEWLQNAELYYKQQYPCVDVYFIEE